MMAFDWTIWILIAVFQLTLASKAVRSHLKKSWFAAYLYFASGKTIALMLVDAWSERLDVYQACSLALALPGIGLIAGAIRESWKEVFGPSLSLPRGTVARFVSTAVIICSLAPVFAGLFSAHTAREYMNALLNTEVATLTAAVVTIAMMIVYSKYLGAYWDKTQAAIIGGFCLALGTNWIVLFAAGRQALPVMEAQRIGQLGYLCALVLWYGVLAKEAAPECVTRAEVEEMLLELESKA